MKKVFKILEGFSILDLSGLKKLDKEVEDVHIHYEGENMFIKKFVQINFLLLMLLLMSEVVFAHGPLMGKGHQGEIKQGPNGGVVFDVDEYYFELIVEEKSGDILLFLLDQNFEVASMPDYYSGLIRLKMLEGKSEWYSFKYITSAANPYLKAETGMEDTGSFHALVGLKINGEKTNFRFNWNANKKQ